MMNKDKHLIKQVARNLIIGDIHGMYDRMQSALSASGFNPDKDNLYSVGDFCDRGPEPIKVLDYLMHLPHFFPVVGNHDMWLYEYLCSHEPDSIWLNPRNGGVQTYTKLELLDNNKKTKIRDWIGSIPFIRTTEKHIILHAGPPEDITGTTDMDKNTLSKAYNDMRSTGFYSPLVYTVVWNRYYIYSAMNPNKSLPYYREPIHTDKSIICGHTPLKEVFHSNDYNITCIDTGSFVQEGHITVMDMDSLELFHSSSLSSSC